MVLIGALAAAAAVSVIANELDSPFLHWLGFAIFICAVWIYFSWRRRALQERRGRVFDREAKTDETRTRADR
jgi:uncharacterized membrane protein YfcA